MRCRDIDPNIILTVKIYWTPAGHCWFPVQDELEGEDVFVGNRFQIAEKIRELNGKHGIAASGIDNPIKIFDP